MGVALGTYARYMAPEVAEVERALLALAPRDRAAVVHHALLSLDSEEAEIDQGAVDAARRDELCRRIEDIESGRVTLVSGEESKARVRALLADLHQ
ncbi:MAG: addiction module protein [Micrococcales bacterium]|nr:addiction module protein [Micrococcales bacterium]